MNNICTGVEMEEINEIIEKLKPLAERIYLQKLEAEDVVDFLTDPIDSWFSAMHFYKAQLEFEEDFGDRLKELHELATDNYHKGEEDV